MKLQVYTNIWVISICSDWYLKVCQKSMTFFLLFSKTNLIFIFHRQNIVISGKIYFCSDLIQFQPFFSKKTYIFIQKKNSDTVYFHSVTFSINFFSGKYKKALYFFKGLLWQLLFFIQSKFSYLVEMASILQNMAVVHKWNLRHFHQFCHTSLLPDSCDFLRFFVGLRVPV